MVKVCSAWPTKLGMLLTCPLLCFVIIPRRTNDTYQQQLNLSSVFSTWNGWFGYNLTFTITLLHLIVYKPHIHLSQEHNVRRNTKKKMVMLTTRRTPVAKQYQSLPAQSCHTTNRLQAYGRPHCWLLLGFACQFRKVVEECSSGEWQHREDRDREPWMSSLPLIEQCYQQLAQLPCALRYHSINHDNPICHKWSAIDKFRYTNTCGCTQLIGWRLKQYTTTNTATHSCRFQ
jgi:hypothetical protein